MRRPKMTQPISLLASLAIVLAVVLGCSTDSPTAPDQVPGSPPVVGDNAWNISVSVDPSQLVADSSVPSTVNVDVRSRDDGSRPANGTTMTLTTTLGDFGAQSSGVNTIGIEIDRGKASALLFAGAVIAGGKVEARLEGSEGRDDFQVVAVSNAFITAIKPNSGSESGGTRVTVEGTGFMAPLRVRFGNFYATVTSSDEDSIEVITPPTSTPLNSQACGTGGTEYLPTPVSVTVEPSVGTAATLASGFFYTPDNVGCIGG